MERCFKVGGGSRDLFHFFSFETFAVESSKVFGIFGYLISPLIILVVFIDEFEEIGFDFFIKRDLLLAKRTIF